MCWKEMENDETNTRGLKLLLNKLDEEETKSNADITRLCMDENDIRKPNRKIKLKY